MAAVDAGYWFIVVDVGIMDQTAIQASSSTQILDRNFS